MKRNRSIVATLIAALGAAFSVSQGAEINVPSDFPATQPAINAAGDGDTIIVSPGRYVENIDFLRKAITVRSTDPLNEQVVESTIIDGGGSRSCVRFVNKETSDSVISGFTIINGYAGGVSFRDNSGGGVFCSYSSPTISYNIIKFNVAEHSGGGICCRDGAAVILSNQIIGNTAFYGG